MDLVLGPFRKELPRPVIRRRRGILRISFLQELEGRISGCHIRRERKNYFSKNDETDPISGTSEGNGWMLAFRFLLDLAFYDIPAKMLFEFWPYWIESKPTI